MKKFDLWAPDQADVQDEIEALDDTLDIVEYYPAIDQDFAVGIAWQGTRQGANVWEVQVRNKATRASCSVHLPNTAFAAQIFMALKRCDGSYCAGDLYAWAKDGMQRLVEAGVAFRRRLVVEPLEVDQEEGDE